MAMIISNVSGIDRRLFTEKYPDIAKAWGLEGHEPQIKSIVCGYSGKYERELPLVQNGEIKLDKYYQDNRQPEEYFYDVLDAWVVEDIAEIWLKERLSKLNPAFVVGRLGSDKDRIFQTRDSYKITTNADFVCSLNGFKRKIEMQMSRRSRRTYDMKKGKVERAFREGILFLWFVIPENAYFFCDPNKDLKDVKPTCNPDWGKDTYLLASSAVKHYLVRDDFGEEVYEILGLKI